jgi:hypothetical protein
MIPSVQKILHRAARTSDSAKVSGIRRPDQSRAELTSSSREMPQFCPALLTKVTIVTAHVRLLQRLPQRADTFVMSLPDHKLPTFEDSCIAVLNCYAIRDAAAKAACPEHTGWLDRIAAVPGLDSAALTPIHGFLIAQGLIRFEFGSRSAGLQYQLSPTGRDSIRRGSLNDADDARHGDLSQVPGSLSLGECAVLCCVSRIGTEQSLRVSWRSGARRRPLTSAATGMKSRVSRLCSAVGTPGGIALPFGNDQRYFVRRAGSVLKGQYGFVTIC